VVKGEYSSPAFQTEPVQGYLSLIRENLVDLPGFWVTAQQDLQAP